MAVPRGGRMAPLGINAEVLRQMVLDGTDPATIALHFGVTDKQLRKWSENHRISLDPEALAKEEPVQRYYTCRDCGAASLRYESADALRRHREEAHAPEPTQAESVRAQPTAGDFGVHLQGPVLENAVAENQPSAPEGSAPALDEMSYKQWKSLPGGPSSGGPQPTWGSPPSRHPSGPTLREVIERTQAEVLQAEREIHAKRTALEAKRADLRVLEEAQRVMDRLAKGGAA